MLGVSPSQVRPLLIKGMRPVMGTFVTVVVADADRESATNAVVLAFEEIERVAGLMNVHDPSSEVGRLNRRGCLDDPSADTRTVIERAVHFSMLSGGAFDATILPVLRLWDDRAQCKALPTDDELQRELDHVGYWNLSTQGHRVSFTRPGMGLTLAGIAKGYAVDRAIEVLRENQIEHVLVNGGGDIRALGGKTDGQPWNVGVFDPSVKPGRLAKMPLVDSAVATSGAYRRPFNDLLDARSGKPARTLISTTVVTDRAMDADVLATAFHVLGPEEGLDLLETAGAERAVYVTNDGRSRQEWLRRSGAS